jgi:hypothetical protein
MKITCLLFLAMSCAALAPAMKMREAPWSAVAAATAFPPSFAHLPYESKGEGGSWCYRTPRRRYFQNSGAAEPAGSRRPARHNLDKPKAGLPKPLPNSRQRSPSGNALHPAGANKIGGAANSGYIRTGTTSNALAGRAPGVIRPTAPPLSNVNHRSPNPAVVGGAPNLRKSNAAVISGASVSRRR